MANLTGSANFMKYLLFIINFCLVITGIIILSVGATVQGVYHGYNGFLDGNYFSVPSLLIAIGVITFIVAFFGCCGAIKENYCMVLTFAILMITIFILELSAGISGYVLRNDAYAMLKTNLHSSMEKYNNDTFLTNLWDEVQKKFQCCGIDAAKDWLDESNKGMPMSCCPIKEGATDTINCTETNAFATGCLAMLSKFVESHAVSLGAAGVILALIQLLGVFFTCYVAKKIKQTYSHSTF